MNKSQTNIEREMYEMKTIKVFDGYKVTVDDETEEFIDKPIDEVWDAIRIPTEKALRDELFRGLFAFGRLDLSEAYKGHTVIVELIPTRN